MLPVAPLLDALLNKGVDDIFVPPNALLEVLAVFEPDVMHHLAEGEPRLRRGPWKRAGLEGSR